MQEPATPPPSPTSLLMEPPHSQVVKAPSGLSRQSGLLLAFQTREVVTTHAESCQAQPFRLNLRKGFYSFERRRNTPNAIFKNHLRSIFLPPKAASQGTGRVGLVLKWLFCLREDAGLTMCQGYVHMFFLASSSLDSYQSMMLSLASPSPGHW